MAEIGSGLTSLQSLDVSYCRKLSDKGLSVVTEGCRNLRVLHLAGCRFVTDGLLYSLSKNCRNLEELGLQGCTNISDTGIIDLVNGCRKITYLDVNKCSNVGDVGISSVSKSFSTSLKTLKLLDCYKVGDESISSIAHFCRSLETLVIGGCRDISAEALKCFGCACIISLKNLRMDWCLNLSDSSLTCILTKCKNIEALDIGCCEEVTDAAFLGVGENQLRLRILKVNCPKVSVLGIGFLLEKCPGLEYLDVRSCPLVSKTACEEAGLQFPQDCKVVFAGSLVETEVVVF